MSAFDREKWDAKYRRGEHAGGAPSDEFIEFAQTLAPAGRALDLAGGTGRHALWLASRGWRVTLADISEVGLELARREADGRGVGLTTLAIDFENEEMPAGPWDLVVCVNFLQRRLLTEVWRALVPGGGLIVAHPTKSNQRRHAKPPSRFLLEDGELPDLVTQLEIERYREGWTAGGQHAAVLLARRPAD